MLSPRAASCILLACVAVGPLAGCETTGPSSIVAERIVLTDASGAPRVFLGVTPQGTGLLIQDARGKIRAGLSLLPDDTAELSLGDGSHMRAVLASRGDRTFLVIRDAQGHDRARVALLPEGPKIETVEVVAASDPDAAELVPVPPAPAPAPTPR